MIDDRVVLGAPSALASAMKVFHCDHCRHLVFFENFECVACRHRLAYLSDLGVVGSLDSATDGLWTSPIPRAKGRAYRLCENYTKHNTCNWAVASADAHALCASCRLTSVIPDLEVEGNKEAWYKLEVAKRRLVYTLQNLSLPLESKSDSPKDGLAFEFKADTGEPVLTGHAEGVITINVAEADDAEREKRRVQLHEPYRTVLGHFRHEVGHYYWDRLIRDNQPRLEAFRVLFGDERRDYGEALKTHYENGPPANWQERFVSSYSTAHPWEDWAETWAHYIHMIDTLETSASCGLAIEPQVESQAQVTEPASPFRGLINRWFLVTHILNNLNRGLGLRDAYPFVLSEPVIQKLEFIHETIATV
jgi:hypothetical protein